MNFKNIVRSIKGFENFINISSWFINFPVNKTIYEETTNVPKAIMDKTILCNKSWKDRARKNNSWYTRPGKYCVKLQ